MSLRSAWRKYARDLTTLPGDLRLLYRRGGWSEVWPAVANRTVFRLVRTGHMLVIAQDLHRVREVPPPPGVVIRPLADSDWPAFATLVPARDLDRFRGFVANGHLCVLAWRGDRLVGYTWYTKQLRPDATMLPIPLPPTAAYLWELYVPPAERSSGIGSALVTARLHLARQAGFHEGWRMIAPSNLPSLRTASKTGGNARVVGRIRFIKLWSRMFARYTALDESKGLA